MPFLYHYTDLKSLRLIAQSKKLKASWGAGAKYGVFFTQLGGSAINQEELVTNNWDRFNNLAPKDVMDRFKDKIKFYVKISPDETTQVVQVDAGARNVWFHQDDLDLTELARQRRVWFGYTIDHDDELDYSSTTASDETDLGQYVNRVEVRSAAAGGSAAKNEH